MGNTKSRSSSSITPITEKQSKNNVIEYIHNKTKCKDCGFSGYEFNTISRDGTTFVKMYYCRNCSTSWNA